MLKLLQAQGSLLVAFSGGVDSSLLLAAAKSALGDQVKAGLCLGAFTPPWEIEAARQVAQRLGVELIELDARELQDPDISANPPDRCYFCKLRRMTLLKEQAQRLGFAAVAEGSQIDDAHGHRPGARALAELGVLSPLAQAGLSKHQVRELSRALGLSTADTPSGACLATRITYGTPLSAQALARVGQAEGALRDLLFGQLRLRDEFPMARLELAPTLMAKAIESPLRERIVEAVLAAGYERVVLDLGGYRPSVPKQA